MTAAVDIPAETLSSADLTTLTCFYRTARAGALRLSDGGGPFGFDITTALQADYLISTYGCDGIVETGCFLGDTTEYLARRYPGLPVLTCDIDADHARFTAWRTRELGNVTVTTGDSAAVVPQLLDGLVHPFLYLDAHWAADWPLAAELTAVVNGIVMIDDFDIGHARFSYDVYDEVICGPSLISGVLPGKERMWAGNPYAAYSLPCLQTGRRAGRGLLTIGDIDDGQLAASPLFAEIGLRPQISWPDWQRLEQGTEAGS